MRTIIYPHIPFYVRAWTATSGYVRSLILAHKWAYWTLTVLTLGNWHSYQCGWESGIDLGMDD